jgi:hypothetical protein
VKSPETGTGLASKSGVEAAAAGRSFAMIEWHYMTKVVVA